jgi:hypothetical protein
VAESKSKTLKVSAPLVVVQTKAGRAVHLYRGDVITDDVTKESVENLKDLGFLAEDDDVLPA